MQTEIDIRCLVGGALENNMYILKKKGNTDVVVIDPADAQQILAEVEKTGEHVVGILLTHGHFDHIRGLDELRRSTKAPVAVMAQDAGMLTDPVENLGMPIFKEAIQTNEADQLLTDGQIIQMADLDVQVMATPGHTPGGACFLCGDILISGDTLFKNSVGRSDLPGGNVNQLIDSFQKIFALSGEYRVFPGHGLSTTLDQERKNNPFWLEKCQTSI